MKRTPQLEQRRRTMIAAGLIVAAGLASYSNSLSGDFVFDDSQYIAHNKALRTLWPPYGWLGFCPTRPVVYFTFAVNYALHGLDVAGYHVVNIAIHLATALGLFGLIRCTLRLSGAADRYRDAADVIAATTALLWVVHPLGTQAVTYVYQRLESLAALFAVLSAYAFVRAYGDGGRPRPFWQAASLIACYLAILSKESVVALPLIVLCYDRLYLAKSWRGVLARRRFHAAMFCSWGVALGLMFASAGDYEKAGIAEVVGVSAWSYAVSQSGVLLHYLRLSFVPTGLCLDYGWPLADDWGRYVPQSIAVLALVVAAGYGLFRGRAWSFPAVAFFLLLAPTSSIVPIADLIFEHRMYLPLACVVVLAVCGGFEMVRRGLDRASGASARRAIRIGTFAFITTIAAVLAYGTIDRNRDYATSETMWLDIVAKAPHNPRPYELLARHHLFKDHRNAEGRRWLAGALRIDPDYPWALRRQATLYIEDGRLDEAEACLRRIRPLGEERVRCLVEMGRLREAQGKHDDAGKLYLGALELDPQCTGAMTNLGLLSARAGRWEEAVALYDEALAVDPEFAPAHTNLGVLHAEFGRAAEAAAEFAEVVRLEPWNAGARSHLGVMLDRLDRGELALVELQRAVVDGPAHVGALVNLGTALARRGRIAEAATHFERALELDPQNSTARENLAQARLDLQAASSSATSAAQAGP